MAEKSIAHAISKLVHTTDRNTEIIMDEHLCYKAHSVL